MSDEPTRIKDDPQLSESVRLDLECAAEEWDADYDVNAGHSRFMASLGLGPGPGHGASGSGDGTGSGGGGPSAAPPPAAAAGLGASTTAAAGSKLTVIGGITVAVVVTSAAIGGTLWMNTRGDQGSTVRGTTPTASRRAAAGKASGAPVAPFEEARAAEAAVLESTKPPSTERTRRRSRSRARHRTSGTRARTEPPHVVDRAREESTESGAQADYEETPPPEDSAIRREIAHLARTRAALSQDPALALSLARAGQREFAGGMLGEERSAIAIFALSRLGRNDEAAATARTHLTHHPRGPFSDRVRRIAEGR